MKISRLITVITIGIMMALCLTACGNGSDDNQNGSGVKSVSDSGDKLSIVTTIFPEYDWVREIMGEEAANADVTMLLDNGADLHSYQPTADDILKISECDLFIYVGGESDKWVEDVMKDATNKDMKVINLLETLGDSVKEEEIVEGMQGEEEEEEEPEAEEEEVEYDEHVWLSLKNAQILCGAITDALKELDKDNADKYDANLAAYNDQLAKLDEEYKNVVDGASNKTILFGDRFPFRYMTDDYGIDYYAAFVGCSAESEASFETVMFLANKVEELGLKSICTIENSDQKIAETIRNATASKEQNILTLDSLQSTTEKDMEEGKTYLNTMKNNLEVLSEALN